MERADPRHTRHPGGRGDLAVTVPIGHMPCTYLNDGGLVDRPGQGADDAEALQCHAQISLHRRAEWKRGQGQGTRSIPPSCFRANRQQIPPGTPAGSGVYTPETPARLCGHTTRPLSLLACPVPVPWARAQCQKREPCRHRARAASATSGNAKREQGSGRTSHRWWERTSSAM